MSFLVDLEPRLLWSQFDEILKIPRGSKNEDKIREYVIGVAERNGLDHKVDAVGNVVVRKPGTSGHENAPATVLQGHLDMVNEKNSDVEHDFDKDPIQPQRDGEYVKATGTTLGSDNGIGVAAMLAVMEDPELVHGPLEMLFTIDEETGLTGAAGLAGDMLEGRLLINLDSEEEGVLTIGCAGGADSHAYLPLSKSSSAAGSRALRVRLSGLKGGHSGIDIHLQRGNAVRLLCRALLAVSQEHRFRLGEILGGNLHNAIPREAVATVVPVDGADSAALRNALERELQAAGEEYRPAEPNLEFAIEETEAPKAVLNDDSTGRVIALIVSLPHGVVSMSYDIKGLVETSTNLAAVAESDGRLSILLSSRSSVASALDALRQRIRAIVSLAGGEVEEDPGYPGWQPDVSSPLLQVVKQLHEEVIGETPEVGAVHAGLECGIIGEKYPGMDMISFGPQIEFPHSPDERIKVSTVKPFYELLAATLRKLA
jgi:dipeptidase D